MMTADPWQDAHLSGLRSHVQLMSRTVAASPDPPVPAPYPNVIPLWETSIWQSISAVANSYLVVPAVTIPGLSASYDDATAINWALGQVGNFGRVFLVAGATYTTFTPITAPASPAGPTLEGGIWWQGTANDWPSYPFTSGGTIIRPDPTFSGAAVIQQTTTSATYIPAMNFRNFTIEGNTLGGTVHGILIQGAVTTGLIDGVMIHRPSGDCLHMLTDPTSGVWPDDWTVIKSKFSSSRTGYGAYLNRCNDITVTSCESSENQLDNWYISGCGNAKFIGCKGENSVIGGGGAGFHILGVQGELQLVGCDSQFNDADGILLTGGASGTNVLITGHRSYRDGRNNNLGGGGFAGYRASGYVGRVIVTGSTCYADTTGPQYGASEVATSYGMCLTGCFVAGATAATHDDATNTHALVNQSPVPF